MKRLFYSILLLLLGVACTPRFESDQVTVGHLRCNHRENPIGQAIDDLRFSWQLHTELSQVEQTAYRILVATSLDKLAAGQADVWDSGKQESDASVLVPYAGPRLETSRYYYWKVQVWTNRTNGYSESSPAHWLTALSTERDWKSSRWIGWDDPMPWDVEETHARLSARYLRTEFDCRKDITQAVVHMAGVGLYELWLNGEKVGNQVMAPVPTDYRKHIMYNSFDVTEQLKTGRNAIGVILGNGRYYAMRQHYKPYKWAQFGYPKMRLVMMISYADGRTQTLTSDTSWKLNANGPIVSNNEFDGEEYDARKEFPGWSQAGFEMNSDWQPAQRVAIPIAQLVPQPCENMKVCDRLAPKSITRLKDNVYVIDMGQNMTGWIRMKLRGEKGRRVTLRFAEALLPDGSLSMANLRDALVTDVYTLKGDAKGEEWAPRFVTHGFQYVELTNYPGTPSLDDFVGEFVCDDMALTGRFHCSSEVLNATLQNAFWGIRGNYKGMPVDCPQRNERMPWLGDRTMGSYGESFLFDNAAFYAKWMDDIRDAQRWDGAIPDVAPAYWNYYSDDITWPAAMFFTCEMLYRQFGDLRPIEKHIAAMKQYMDYMRSYYLDPQTGLMTADKYGDWCMPPESPEIIHSSDPARVTDKRLIATAYFYGLYQCMIRFSQWIGQPHYAEHYAEYAQSLKEAFHRQFFDEEKGYYSNNTVTANVLALAFELCPEAHKAQVVQHIEDKIMQQNGGTMSSGIIGNQWLFRQLKKQGLGYVAYRLATTTDYPSFGYMWKQGATTIWELWNGDTANPKMNSRNHVMQLGDLLIWAFEDLAGIKSSEEKVAFKELVMKPDFSLDDLQFVEASYETPYGLVKSEWKKQDGQLEWNISVPANSAATIYLPLHNQQDIQSNLPLRSLGKQESCKVYRLLSGHYQIRIKL